jgi:hypothetical protein
MGVGGRPGTGDIVDMLDWTILGWAMAGLLGFCTGILTERYLVGRKHPPFRGPNSPEVN